MILKRNQDGAQKEVNAGFHLWGTPWLDVLHSNGILKTGLWGKSRDRVEEIFREAVGQALSSGKKTALSQKLAHSFPERFPRELPLKAPRLESTCAGSMALTLNEGSMAHAVFPAQLRGWVVLTSKGQHCAVAVLEPVRQPPPHFRTGSCKVRS